MKINKSSRHPKITGDFGEHLTLYFLSKYGYECARIDHVGIDLIARSPGGGELMGISVKSRSRNDDEKGGLVKIPRDNFEKIRVACKAFGCTPYFSIVVDLALKIHCCIVSLDHYFELFPSSDWSMSERWIEIYVSDPEVMYFSFDCKWPD